MISTIEDALKNGFKLHSFLSGGRLRVICLDPISETEDDEEEEDEELGKRFYGEGVNFREALRILKDDVKAGGRKYSDVYGPIETPYMTGTYADTDIDTIMFSGNVDAVYDEESKMVKAIIDVYVKRNTPKEIIRRVSNELVGILWTLKEGKDVYEFLSTPMQFANHEFGCSTKTISKPESETDSDSFMPKKKFYGYSDTFENALEMAVFEHKTMLSPEWDIISVDEKWAEKNQMTSYVRKEESEPVEGDDVLES